MKTNLFTTLFLTLFVTLFTAACGHDDETSATVVGQWKLESYVLDNAGELEKIKLTIDRLILTADNHFTLYYPDGNSDSGTYEAGTNYLRLDTQPQGSDEAYRFMFEIRSLDQQKMVVFYHDDSGFDFTATLVRM